MLAILKVHNHGIKKIKTVNEKKKHARSKRVQAEDHRV